MKHLLEIWKKTSLIKKIAIGVLIGIVLGIVFPQLSAIGLLGDLFVGGLRAIAPVLVFALVANALAQHKEGQQTNMGTIIALYLIGTFAAALVAVITYYIHPLTITLSSSSTEIQPPSGIGEVFSNLLLKLVDNPVAALAQANYIGILSWACVFGFALKSSSKATKDLCVCL